MPFLQINRLFLFLVSSPSSSYHHCHHHQHRHHRKLYRCSVPNHKEPAFTFTAISMSVVIVLVLFLFHEVSQVYFFESICQMIFREITCIVIQQFSYILDKFIPLTTLPSALISQSAIKGTLERAWSTSQYRPLTAPTVFSASAQDIAGMSLTEPTVTKK